MRRIAAQEVADAAYHIIPHPRRRHGFAVFQYTLSGSGIFRDAAGDRPVPTGTAFLCHAEDPQVAYRHPGHRRPWRFVYASWYCARETIDALVTDGPLFRLRPDHPLIREMLTWRQAGRPQLSGARSAELATRLITRLAACRPARQHRPAPSLVTRIDHLVAEADPVPSVTELARRLDLSREHLSRRFAACVGITLRDHLQNLRLQRATGLLRGHESPSIAEIAQRCGFSDSGHLARHFRRLHGITPQRYRELVRHGSDI